MRHQYWLGTEEALFQLIETERLASDNFVALMDRRKAFFDGPEDSVTDDENIGDYLISVEQDTAIIRVSGSLTNGHRWYHEFLDGRVTSYEAISDALDTAVKNPDIRQVVLQINSGGGSVTGIEALGEKIRRTDQIKPVRAHTSTAAFSAAYWIASSTREVVATRMAEVGSIGTLMVHKSIARMAKEVGIDFTVFRAGKYKAIGLPYEELTEDDKAYLQADVEKANSFFLEHVSLSRNLMISEKQRWAEGRTFFAGEAKDVGLVDRVASLEEIIGASGAQPRRNRMLISDEKRAQIAAGARAEDVLTAEELKHYQAEMDESGSGDGETVIAQEKLDRIEAGEKPEDVLEAAELEKYRAENPAPAPDPTAAGIDAEYRQLLRDNGKLEARVEAAEAKAADLEEKLAGKQAQIEGLTEIGKAAVHNLQVALGKPRETAASPEGLVTAYNNLQTEMAERFKPGRHSQAPSEESPEANVPLAFRTHRQ